MEKDLRESSTSNKRKLDSEDESDNGNISMNIKNIEPQIAFLKLDDIVQSKKPRIQNQVFKNSIQILNEIHHIQPLTYTFKSNLDCLPVSKHIFICNLKFVLNHNELNFDASGNSKKQAKSIVSLKAMHYLTEKANIFGTLITEYHRSLILSELKSLNLSIDQIITSSSLISTAPISENKSIEESQLSPISACNISPSTVKQSKLELSSLDQIQNDTNSYYLIKSDTKTSEILKTQNALGILNYLIPNDLKFIDLTNKEDFPMNEINSSFKVALVIRKDLESSKLLKNSLRVENTVSSIFVVENEEEFQFIGCGSSKKKARHKGAIIALEFLFSIKADVDEKPSANNLELSITSENNEQKVKFQKFADYVNQMMITKYQELFDKLNSDRSNIKEITDLNELNFKKFLNVYAGIVQSNGLDLNTVKLISFTTGTKCINGEYMSMTGTALNDCHAEILAVRLLRKYLYSELSNLLEYLCENPGQPLPENSIFESDIISEKIKSNQKFFRIKKNVNFHLLISSAPCGDGRIFSINSSVEQRNNDNSSQRKVHGLLRAKIEWGMGTIPVTNKEKLQTWDGIMLGERLRVMSCSDKLCKYNMTGVQGALLSHFIEPVYLDSLIVGGHYHRKHLERALYQRISIDENEIPTGYKINKISTTSITNHAIRTSSKPSNKSLIWSNEITNENNLEIINTKIGKLVNEQHSGVCKLELLRDWSLCFDRALKVEALKGLLVDEFRLTDVDVKKYVSNQTYHDIKQKANEYQKTKLLLYKSFDKKGYGKWITKPFEQNYFRLDIDCL